MAELQERELRTVIEDVRARHAAVVNVIYAVDAQAMSLMRLYVTLGIAAASGAAAGFGPSTIFSRPMAWALLAGMAAMVLGAGFCLRAMKSVSINLPGRGAAFWKWALLPNVTDRAVLNAYLDNLEQKRVANDVINQNASAALKWAKRCGAMAPLAALAAGTAAALGGF